MNGRTIHPRIAARRLGTLRRRVLADHAVAIAGLERAVRLLRELAREPGCEIASQIMRVYESALRELKALDPTDLPSAASLIAIGTRLQVACDLLSIVRARLSVEENAEHHCLGHHHGQN